MIFINKIKPTANILSNFKRKFSIYKPFINPKVQRIQKARLITALKTPYLENGKIDLESFDNHIEKQLKYGVEGFVIGGTTGEGHLFSWDEHIMLIAHAKYKFGSQCLILGNTGSNSTTEAVYATKQGFAVGMDASLQINPYYGKTSNKGILKHFNHVLDEGPAIIYNVPGRTAQDITVDLMTIISEHYNFIGVKECMGVERIQTYTDKNIITWSGNDDECHDARHYHGCNGVISVTSNIIPGIFRELMDEKNTELDIKAQELIDYLFIEPNPIGINTMMMMLGLCKPNFRLPYVELNKDLRKEIKEVIDNFGIENILSNNNTCQVLKDNEFNYISNK